MSVSGSDKTD